MPYEESPNIYVEWHPNNIASKSLFESYGFRVVDTDEEGEVIGKLSLDS